MNREKFEFMSLPRVPGRMNVEEAAWYLGFSQTDISILVGVALLKPLGKPAPNAIRYFARPDLDQLCADAKWLIAPAPLSDGIGDYATPGCQRTTRQLAKVD